MTQLASPDDEKPGNPPAASQERVLQFSPADTRLLIITIIGTVVGALIVVLVVGLALALDRLLGPANRVELGFGLVTTLVYPFATAGWGFLAYGNERQQTVLPRWLRTLTQEGRWRKRATRVVFWIMVLFCVTYILNWVGYAAGISK